jgi:hypothetical protein
LIPRQTGIGEALFRSMQQATDGGPVVGESARRLGARQEIDVELGRDSMVQPTSGGMSVSPGSPENLPRHRKPPEWGGTGLDPVWELTSDELGEGLLYSPDPAHPDAHGFIEPSGSMTFPEYQGALAKTRPKWRLAERSG